MKSAPEAIDAKVLARVRRMRPGLVFTVRSFVGMDAGPSLNRMVRAGHVRRLASGIWHKPENNPLIGEVPPSSPAIAAAVAELNLAVVQPAGGSAANVLGLSDQVPARSVFLTSGPSRSIRLGKRQVILKHAAPKHMAGAGTVAGLIITALRHIGRAHVDDVMLEAVRRAVPATERRKVARLLQGGPDWIAKAAIPVLTR